ncbi:hypothetical protein TWF706_000750 [Orbilia oligospora]|nr:hypothetical protein TWF706_000750 [Orbilia oligospora]
MPNAPVELQVTHTYSKLKDLSGEELFGLFRKIHPRLRVFRETYHQNQNEALEIISECPVCIETFKIGEKVYAMPCSQLHVTHTKCFNHYLKSIENNVNPRMKEALYCIHCRTRVSLFHNLFVASQQYQCLVGVGNLGTSDDKAPFACLEGEDGARFRSIPHYLPWSKFRRYIKVAASRRPIITAPAVYQVNTKSNDNPRNPEASVCLRTNRERLCEAPSLRFLREYLASYNLQHGERPRRPAQLLNMYLLSDIVNYITIKTRTLRHIYLQVRVNSGQVAWFGFREYRDYCLRNFTGLLDAKKFQNQVSRFSYYHGGASHLGQLNSSVRELVLFDIKVEQKYQNWLNSAEITNLQPDMEELYGRPNETWENENQDERREDWRSDDADLEAPEGI